MHSPSPLTARTMGIAAAILAAVLGSAWQIASRHAVTTTLGPLSLAVLRYVIPTLVLLPIVLRTGLFPRGLPRWKLAALVAGAGLPFFLVMLTGARFAPVAHMGVMSAALMPVLTALLAWRFYGDAIAPLRILGFASIGTGVVLLGQAALSTMGLATAGGDVLFVLAALLWAVYSVVFRGAGLTPWQGVALVNAWSALLVLPLYLAFGDGQLTQAPVRDVLLHAAVQGLLAGVVGVGAYTVSVQRLGASSAAAFTALVPVLSTLGGALLLREVPTLSTLLAVALAAGGVFLASGLVRWRGAANAAR